MKSRFWLFKRGQTYYVEDSTTGKQESLHTTDRRSAERLRAVKNEAAAEPTLSLAIGRAYLTARDAKIAKRTWQEVMNELASHGCESSQIRCRRAMRSETLDRIRHQLLIETTSEDFLFVLKSCPVSTNHYLRRLSNLALGLGWLPWPVLAPKFWPKVKPQRRRAITWDEHQRVISTERNQERRLYYELLWETGAAQTDAATLRADNVDVAARTISYRRRKTGQVACLVIGSRLAAILNRLPAEGLLFPGIAWRKATDRAAEFRRRCRLVGIQGVTLHSYRYAWAQRAKACGYSERWAQAALGHNSRAIHEAYARDAMVACPPLEDFEHAQRKVVPFTQSNGRSIGVA